MGKGDNNTLDGVSDMQIVAKHKKSGAEKHFDNVAERENYIIKEIRDEWVFFFRFQNGFEMGHL